MKRLIVCIFLCASSWCGAAIFVSPMMVDFTNRGDNSQPIAVTNNSDKVEYVQITPYQITNVGTKMQEQNRIINPDNGLIVFPSKLKLEPNETQYVKIVSTIPPGDNDQNYMVQFIPKIAGLDVDKKIGDKSRFGLHILIGYGVRVIVRPKHMIPKVAAKRLNKTVLIENNGNTSLTLTKAYQIIDGQTRTLENPCTRLYAGKKCTFSGFNPKYPVFVETNVMNKAYETLKIG